jgi:hypothetical protein
VSTPSLFGFAVEREVPLRFLREGGGVERLRVSQGPADASRPVDRLIIEWPLRGGAADVTASLYEIPGGFEYWTSDSGRFGVFLDEGRIEVPPMTDEILREQRLNGIPMALAFTHRGDFALHAAAVQVAGGAVLLAAPSRFGKTTLALAFHQRGFAMLAEDLICCRVSDLSALAGPAVIRLRPDVYSGEPPPGMREVARRPDRVFLAPDPAARGTSSPVPIRGIVFLREGDEVRVTPASPVEAIRDLWHLNFRLPATEDREASFRALSALASGVPVWDLKRPFRLEALPATVEAIVACGAS